jgi:hypothetical protein
MNSEYDENIDASPFKSDEGRLSELFEIACQMRNGIKTNMNLLPDENTELTTILHLLDAIDDSWENVPTEIDNVQALFLQKLAVQEPDHPWVLNSTVQTLGELYRISLNELPVLPDDSSQRLAKDPTLVRDLFDTSMRSKLLGLALRSAAVPQKKMGEMVLGINRMLSALAPLSKGSQQNFVFTRRQKGRSKNG